MPEKKRKEETGERGRAKRRKAESTKKTKNKNRLWGEQRNDGALRFRSLSLSLSPLSAGSERTIDVAVVAFDFPLALLVLWRARGGG